MDVETGICRDFQFHLELRVAGTRDMELHVCVVSVHVKVDASFFHMAFAPRLDCVPQPDFGGITAAYVKIANAQPHAHVSAGRELTGVCMRLFVLPVACCTERDKQQTKHDKLARFPGLER